MNAEDIMTADPMTIEARARVADALQILQTLEVRHLPVVNGKGTLIGMISDRDLRGLQGRMDDGRVAGESGSDVRSLESGFGFSRRTLAQPVSEIMSSDVQSIGPETEVAEIIDLLLELKVGALPVVDGHTSEIRGIVSYVDVLRALRDQLADE